MHPPIHVVRTATGRPAAWQGLSSGRHIGLAQQPLPPRAATAHEDAKQSVEEGNITNIQVEGTRAIKNAWYTKNGHSLCPEEQANAAGWSLNAGRAKTSPEQK